MHHWIFRSGLYGENLSLLEGLLTYCSYSNYHGQASFSYISMHLLANRLLKKQKVGSARRVSLHVQLFSMVGLPSQQCNVFSIDKNFDSLSRVNSVNGGKINAWARGRELLTGAKGSPFFSYKRSLQFIRLER